MICLDNTDTLEGGASVNAVVDYTVHGLVGSTFTQLAAGQLSNTDPSVLYTAAAAVSIVSITLVNTYSAAVTVNLYLDPGNGGTPRRMIPKNVSLGIGYSLHYDGQRISVMNASGAISHTIDTSAFLDDTAGGTDALTTKAPTSNVMYDHGVATTGVHGVGAGTIAKTSDIPIDGWTPVSGTWTYASSTTINVPSGAASLYGKGDKIKLTQTTVKYFYVIAVADTLLTVTGGTGYTVANAAINSPFYSHTATPIGFPDWFTYTPAYTGSESMTYSATNTAKFMIVGTSCVVLFNPNGTTGGTASYGLNATLPVASTILDIGAGAITHDGSAPMAGTFMIIDANTAQCRKTDGSNYGLGTSRTTRAQITYSI